MERDRVFYAGVVCRSNWLPACLAVGLIGAATRAEEATPALIPAPPAPARPAELASLDTPQGELGYALGLRIGSRIAADFKQEGSAVDVAALARGLADAILGAPPLVAEEKVARALDAFDRRMQERERSFLEQLSERARANKAKAVEFLAANAKKRGVRTTPSGLQYEILTKGQGGRPRPDQSIEARFIGRRIDGREFDRTPEGGPPVVFPLEETIPGWQEALPLMAAGSKWRLFVPPEMAYGEAGRLPSIEPNELLVFEIELVAVVDGASADRSAGGREDAASRLGR